MKELEVDAVYIDKCSGKDTNRPALQELFDILEEGDTVIVESYSRMSRSTTDLLRIVGELHKKGVNFISKKENLDTTTPAGKLMLTIFAGLNQFEREVMLDRQREGIEAMPIIEGRRVSARNGRGFGRPKKEPEEIERLKEMHRRGEITVTEACRRAGIGRTTWYKLMQ